MVQPRNMPKEDSRIEAGGGGRGGWPAPVGSALFLGALVALVVGAGTILLVPLGSVTASGQVEAVNCRSPYCAAIPVPPTLTFPAGKTVQVTWAAESSPPGEFGVRSLPDYQWVCWSVQPEGSCTFTSDGGQYWFELTTPPNPQLGTYESNFTAAYSTSLL